MAWAWAWPRPGTERKICPDSATRCVSSPCDLPPFVTPRHSTVTPCHFLSLLAPTLAEAQRGAPTLAEARRGAPTLAEAHRGAPPLAPPGGSPL
eukprot:352580-Chlamydomonas_euryale.AAC.1